jgi:hypothetical protein
MKWVTNGESEALAGISSARSRSYSPTTSQSPSSEVRKNRVSGALQIQLESLILAQNER